MNTQGNREFAESTQLLYLDFGGGYILYIFFKTCTKNGELS